LVSSNDNPNGKMMMRTISMTFAVVMALTACNAQRDAGPMEEMPMDQPDEMPGMQGMQGTQTDPGMMRRHADEMDQMTSRMRQHIQQMRQLSPEQQYERMGEHVTQVSRMLGLMNRQMSEMDMGMGVSDEQMGRMIGMSGEEHRRMMEQMQALRAELEQLQNASRTEIRERMPAHLDRVQEMMRMLETSAAHVRAM
jgi:hypothetical protein